MNKMKSADCRYFLNSSHLPCVLFASSLYNIVLYRCMCHVYDTIFDIGIIVTILSYTYS